MLLPTRHTLTSAALLLLSLSGLTDATSTFSFPDCVENCVASSGCESESAKCICKAKNANFLDEVVKCMYYHCKDELRDVNNSFLKPVKTGCDAAKSPIPKEDLTAAEKVANSLISKLPKVTTTTGTTLNPTKAPPVSTGKTPSSSSTSTAAVRTTSSSSSPETSTSTTLIVAPTSDTARPDTPTTTQTSPGRVPTDSSPFATFDSSASRIGGVGWLALPLIAAFGLR